MRALILATVLLAGASQAADLQPFLKQGDIQPIQAALPKPPAKGDAADTLDHLTYQETRSILHGARGQAAAEDDIFDVDQIVPTFATAYGLRLSRQQQPELFRLFDELMGDKRRGLLAC